MSIFTKKRYKIAIKCQKLVLVFIRVLLKTYPATRGSKKGSNCENSNFLLLLSSISFIIILSSVTKICS